MAEEESWVRQNVTGSPSSVLSLSKQRTGRRRRRVRSGEQRRRRCPRRRGVLGEVELGLVLRPVGVGGEHAVEELLRDRLSSPLLRGDLRRVDQRLPLVLRGAQPVIFRAPRAASPLRWRSPAEEGRSGREGPTRQGADQSHHRNATLSLSVGSSDRRHRKGWGQLNDGKGREGERRGLSPSGRRTCGAWRSRRRRA